MEPKIDARADVKPLSTYKVHLIPCKVRYTGPTEEFQDNFQMDSEHDQSLKKSEPDQACSASHVTYIRGRKIVGLEVLSSKEHTAFLMNSFSDASDGLTMKPIAEVSSIVNYERDGNEERLREEASKLNELLELSEVIHS